MKDKRITRKYGGAHNLKLIMEQKEEKKKENQNLYMEKDIPEYMPKKEEEEANSDSSGTSSDSESNSMIQFKRAKDKVNLSEIVHQISQFAIQNENKRLMMSIYDQGRYRTLVAQQEIKQVGVFMVNKGEV